MARISLIPTHAKDGAQTVAEIGYPSPRLGRGEGVVWRVDGLAAISQGSFGNRGPPCATEIWPSLDPLIAAKDGSNSEHPPPTPGAVRNGV